MGKFAEFLHLNVAGSVRVELERREFVAGDFLRGAAYVSVRRPVQADGASLCVSVLVWFGWAVCIARRERQERSSTDCQRCNGSLSVSLSIYLSV